MRRGHALREASRAECDERHAEARYALDAPSGNRLELVQGGPGAGACAYGREAGITSFSHVGLRSTNARRDESFWTGALGARVSGLGSVRAVFGGGAS